MAAPTTQQRRKNMQIAYPERPCCERDPRAVFTETLAHGEPVRLDPQSIRPVDSSAQTISMQSP